MPSWSSPPHWALHYLLIASCGLAYFLQLYYIDLSPTGSFPSFMSQPKWAPERAQWAVGVIFSSLKRSYEMEQTAVWTPTISPSRRKGNGFLLCPVGNSAGQNTKPRPPKSYCCLWLCFLWTPTIATIFWEIPSQSQTLWPPHSPKNSIEYGNWQPFCI